MQVTNCSIISTILVIGAFAVLSAYDHDEMSYIACPQAPLGQPVAIPHPFSCSKFYYCVLGNFVEFRCPLGFHFDRKTRVCNQEEKANCSIITPKPIPISTESWDDSTPGSSNFTTYDPMSPIHHESTPSSNITMASNPTECGQTDFTGYSSGVIVSPGYPDQVYPNNLRCYYTISTPTPGSWVNFHINNISLERDDPDCWFDYIDIYDGPFISNYSIAHICSNSDDIKSSTNEVLVYFQSDATRAGLGFSITFSEIPNPEADNENSRDDI